MIKKRIVDARLGGDGRTTHVRFEGNRRFTPVIRAIAMADRGEVENAHVVRRRNARPHLRHNPVRCASPGYQTVSALDEG
jgi:hypothetical protein